MAFLSSLLTALHAVSKERLHRACIASLLLRRLAPVLVDAILELDDSEVADLVRERLVQEDGLQQWVVAPCLLPLLQLFGARLDLCRVGGRGRAQHVEEDALGQRVGLCRHLDRIEFDVHGLGSVRVVAGSGMRALGILVQSS